MPFVVLNDEGRAHSIGTVPPGPLPVSWSAVEIADADWQAIRTGRARWDDATGAVVPVVVADFRAELLAALDADVLLVDDLRDIVRQVIEQGVV